MKYDLIAEPWVPVVRQEDGSIVSVGLKEALTQAHLFKAIRHPLPTVEFGLYRLLVALVLDIFFLTAKQDRNTKRLKGLIEKGQFGEAEIEAYFTKYGDRFDLFSETYPFLQDSTASGKDKPVAILLPSQPSGTNTNHFQHGHEDDFSLTPVEAAQLLTTVAPFMTELMPAQSLRASINGNPPIYVLTIGDTLFETLCFNLCAVPIKEEEKNDMPVWRLENPYKGEKKSIPGYALSLTWPARSILLSRQNPIKTMKHAPGAVAQFSWHDPNVAYRTNVVISKALLKSQPWADGTASISAEADREIWRDVAPLTFLMNEDKNVIQPQIVSQFSILNSKKREMNASLYFLRCGTGSQNTRVYEWGRGLLSVPISVTKGGVIANKCSDMLDESEKAANVFSSCIEYCHPARFKKVNRGVGNELPDWQNRKMREQLKKQVNYAERGFWATLRPVYNKLLSEFAELPPGDFSKRDALQAGWKKAVRSAAYAAFERAVGDYDTDNHAIERVTRARKQLGFGLMVIFETATEKETREAKKKAKPEKQPKESNQGVLSL